MSKAGLSLRNNFFSANIEEMLSGAVSDLKIVTRTGEVASNKMAFFGLLPSMRNLLFAECCHEDSVIILPEEGLEDVKEAISEMSEDMRTENIIKILLGQKPFKNNIKA